MITRICRYCKRPYETFPSIRKQFCSAACANLFKTTSTLVPCLVCGKLTKSYPSRVKQYCSKSCARTALNLTAANPALHRDVSGEKNPMWRGGRAGPRTGAKNPSYGRRREQSPRWKGGRKVRKDGYVLVVAPEGHPHPADRSKRTGIAYILEHRLVMEQLLGRYLRPEEVVHHRDNNPSNNAPENLVLYASQREHLREGHPDGRRRRITQRLRERLALPPPAGT